MKDCKCVLSSKGHDYSDKSDRLSNFKQTAAHMTNYGVLMHPSQAALFFILVKIDRLTNLLNERKTPNNESIEDTLKDLLNYVILMIACLKDEGKV